MIDHDPNDYPAPPAWGDLSDSQQLRQIRDAEDAQEQDAGGWGDWEPGRFIPRTTDGPAHHFDTNHEVDPNA